MTKLWLPRIQRTTATVLLGWCCSCYDATSFPLAANAACVEGDLSPECIGVYKMPSFNQRQQLDNTEVRQNSDSTMKSIRAALDILEAQRVAASDIQDVVAAGRLEEAGIKVLQLLSKLTTTGRMVKSEIGVLVGGSDSSEGLKQIRLQQLDELYATAEFTWREIDVEIGQGIRGQLGAPAVSSKSTRFRGCTG